MTLLVASLAPQSLAELELGASKAWAGGADAVEVRIDEFADDPTVLAAYLKARKTHTWIVTCRSKEEGGRFEGDVTARVACLIAAAGGTDAFVDFEWADWRSNESALRIREGVKLASARTDGQGHRLILSFHDFGGGGDTPQRLSNIVGEILAAHDDTVCKVAYESNDINDSFAALDLMRFHSPRVTAICMREEGLWTRILAKKIDAPMSYCCLAPDRATAPGQLTLSDMVNRYRWPAIDSETKIFGVLGDPVAHSMGPLLFNRWFADARINAVYLPLRARGGDESLARFLDGCVGRPWLSVGGFSVTLPHKTAVLDWVGSGADRLAASIGAVNTLALSGVSPRGYNTDCYAAVDSLAGALGCSRGDLAALSIDVLGTGGAARAVIAGLRDFGCGITVYGRSPERTRRLAERFDARPAAWDDRADRSSDVVINCTNVGMWPAVDASPMPADSLDRCRLVFDLVYNPLETALLRQARQAGVATLSGLDMFIRQAAVQFELWTSTSPDTRLARELITAEIHTFAERQR